MKKIISLVAFVIVFFSVSFKSFAAFGTYHYGFILSCGETVYRTFSHKLSDEELLFWADYYEEQICGFGQTL